MSKEYKIWNGLIINNSQIITGITDDSGLTNLSNVLPTTNAVKGFVDYETSQRTSADNSLSTVISTEYSQRVSVISSLQTVISTEYSQRTSVDASISSAVSTLDNSLDTLNDSISTETSQRESAVSSLSSSITGETSLRTSADSSLTSAISGETSLRTSVDTSLTSAITGETSQRTSVDTSLKNAITGETSQRTSADLSLNNAITGETSQRTSADSSLTSSITGETSLRTSVDTSLGNSISVEVSQRIVSDKLFTTTMSTGLLKGGSLSITGGYSTGYTYDISAGSGYTIDNHTDVNNPTISRLFWNAKTGNTPTQIGTQLVTYVSLDSSGNIVETYSPPDATGRRNYIYLGTVVHSNHTYINAINNQPTVAIDVAGQLQDFMQSIGFRSVSGNRIIPYGTNMMITKEYGIAWKPGVNFQTLNTQPHQFILAVQSGATFRYRSQYGVESGDTTLIDPLYYDVSGVTTPLPTGGGYANSATIQRVYIFSSGLIRIQRGQKYYSNITDAINNGSSEQFNVEKNISENGLYLGNIIVRRDAVNLSLITDAVFVPSTNVSSSGAISVIPTLQQSYDVSNPPQINIGTSKGSLQIKNSTGDDTYKLIEILNQTGTTTFSVKANGNISGTTLQLTSQLYLSGITNDSSPTDVLYYNSTTKQVTFGTKPSGGSGTPGGLNTYVQYNSGGTFSGSSNLTFDNYNLSLNSDLIMKSDKTMYYKSILGSTSIDDIRISMNNGIILFQHYDTDWKTMLRIDNDYALSGNIFIGYNSGNNYSGDTNSSYNTFIGDYAGYNISGSSFNTGIGSGVLLNLNTGSGNTSIGDNSGNNLITGCTNIFIGHQSGKYETGSNNLYIDVFDRTSYVTGKTNSLIYGLFDLLPSNQELHLNSKFYVSQLTNSTKSNTVYYDTVTKEITYSATKILSLASFYTDMVTSGTSQTVLYTYDLPSNTLSNNGDSLELFWSITGNNSNGTILLSFSTNSFNFNGINFSNGTVNVKETIIRVSNTVIRRYITLLPWSNPYLSTMYTEVTGLNLQNNGYTISLSATTSSGTITAKGGTIILYKQ